MMAYVGLVGLLALVGSKVQIQGIFPQYLSKKNSNAVKGIFILLIFASHFYSQAAVRNPNQLDILYSWFARVLGQGVVTYMLFCSGYGVMLSADQKGESYIKAFPQKRILKTLLVYDLAQICFLFFHWFRGGGGYSAKDFILSMLAWETFGVDNWYIFVILGLYIISWLVLRDHKADNQAAVIITMVSLAFLGFLTCSKGWYTTLLCYPLGVWYYLYQGKIDSFMRSTVCYCLATIILLVLYAATHKFWYNVKMYIVTMLFFVLSVIAITMKFQINNRILIYCGEHLQGLFLLHRIPMIALGDIPFMKTHIYLWFALSISITFFAEFLFHKLITYMQSGQKGP